MLTNIELILLKFIREKPSYAYEIERMIDERGIRNWVKIVGTTIYQVLDRLAKKGILQASLEKEGNMPQRKMIEKLKETYPALTYRNSRYYWYGQCISLIGTWMQATAQQWLVYTITKSALLLGLLGATQFGPIMFLSLFAGVVIDR